MANYPNSFYSPRPKENKPGITYDPERKIIIFKEDFDSLENEIKAIEQALGLNLRNIIERPEPGLVLYLPFDEGEGTITKDLSLCGNHGNLKTPNGPTWSTGRVGKCLSFDGTDDYVDCGHNASLSDIVNNFTMELWANPSATHQIDQESTTGTAGTSGQKYAIGAAHGSEAWGEGHAGAGISIGTNGVSVYEHASSYMPALLVYSGSITGWNHIVIAYTNKQPKLYLNGNLVRTGLTSPKDYVHPGLRDSDGIGGMSYGFFNGLIDEVRIYNRALSANEVMAHYLRS